MFLLRVPRLSPCAERSPPPPGRLFIVDAITTRLLTDTAVASRRRTRHGRHRRVRIRHGVRRHVRVQRRRGDRRRRGHRVLGVRQAQQVSARGDRNRVLFFSRPISSV